VSGLKKLLFEQEVRIQELGREVEALSRENHDIRTSEERYKSLFEAVPVSVQVVNAEGTITDVNPFHLEKMGRGHTIRDDYMGQCIMQRPSIIDAGLSEKYAKALEGVPFEVVGVYFPTVSEGGDGYSNVRGVPLKRGNDVTGAIYISEDVTVLKRAQQELSMHKERLEELVKARTAELRETNEKLQVEILHREKASGEKELLIRDLRDALGKVKTLSGFIPICAACKKVRDDHGYWDQVEAYFQKHSEVEFSHSLCPECTRRLYPELSTDPQMGDSSNH
jgi:PAS domain S-box-containing protein